MVPIQWTNCEYHILAYERSSLSLSNLTISSSFKFIHASIPSPNLVSVNVIRFLYGKLARPIHKGFPHPKLTSYLGNPHNPEKVETTVSGAMSFPLNSLTRSNCSLLFCRFFTSKLSSFLFASLNLRTIPYQSSWLVSLDTMTGMSWNKFPKVQSGNGGFNLLRKFTA